METATDLNLVTYDMPSELPPTEGELRGTIRSTNIAMVLIAIPGFVYSWLGWAPVLANTLNGNWPWWSWVVYVLGLIGFFVLFFAGFAVRHFKADEQLDTYYKNVAQGKIVKWTQSTNGDNKYYVVIRGNNRMNQLRTQWHEVDADRCYNGYYVEGQYITFPEPPRG